MDKLLKSPWFIRIISLILAVLLWVSVNLENNNQPDSQSLWFNDNSSETQVMNNIPLDVEFDSDQYVVSGLPQDVSVTVQGPKSVIAPVVRQKNFTVYVDLNGLKPGTHNVPVQHTGISNRITTTIEPKTVDVTIEKKISKEFQVGVDYINGSQISNDFDLGEAEMSPEKVTVTGAESVMDKVEVVKAIVNITNTEDSVEKMEAPVKVYDGQGNELNVLVDPPSVDVNVPVSKPKKKVPIELKPEGGAPEGVVVNSMTPQIEEVTIYGPHDVIDSINEITDIPIDISKINKDQTVEVTIPKPEGVTSINPEKVKVDIDVENSEENQS
ncbi:CdaR family protein [Halobacillus salinarum]|uniref:CdaR family protein n=1 Tax=Halobacillus salinarum TaxID=2932257 RepID=A0ABY4ER18_9BACI|nr:CdaR family protein [Halobacillus salinarum]UOQ44561.1 CdaR family protein [Halobacillus salinarum]